MTNVGDAEYITKQRPHIERALDLLQKDACKVFRVYYMLISYFERIEEHIPWAHPDLAKVAILPQVRSIIGSAFYSREPCRHHKMYDLADKFVDLATDLANKIGYDLIYEDVKPMSIWKIVRV